MDYFLVSDDYSKLIESSDLAIVDGGDADVLNQSMDSGIEEVAGYIRHRYNENEIFKTHQLTSDGLNITASNGDRLYQTTTKKFYFCIKDATSKGITETEFFTEGDNRNPKIVDVTIDVLLYHMHSRISPRNIPDLRRLRYDGDDPQQRGGAIGYLKQVQKGIITPDLPVTDNSDQSGHRVSWGKSDTTKYKVQ